MVDDWADIILRDKGNKYVTGIPEFDKEFNHNLRGKFIALIGKGGSGKSMLGLQIATGNSIGTDTIGVFLNGEMSNSNLLDRILDFQYGEDEGSNKRASIHFKDSLSEQNSLAFKKKLKDNLNEMYKDNLLITNTTDMSEIHRGLSGLQNQGKNVVGLVIDSSSMMDGKGNNVESAEYYAKEFKKIANKYNICVLVIYHVPKSVPSDKRDLSGEAKDSVTIENNADAMISFSSVFDESGKKINDIKFLQLFNKRGSGNYVEKVCRVDKNHLVLEPTEMSPESFPEKEVNGF